MSSQSGSRFSSDLMDGRYELRDLLGRGGMGEVWKAWDTKLRRPVAVKLLSSELAAQTAVKQRFKAEAYASASLSHPNVVGVYDTGEHEGIPFLVMELLSGRTLSELLEEGVLDPDEVKGLAVEVLGGLAAAHEAGIIHRDIKPGNILLGADGTAKLADFGIAKGVEGLDLTQTGALLGTPAYLAPERVAGEAATAESDLYSLGVVLYEALSGTRPFLADTAVATALKIQNELAPPLTQINPSIDPQLAAAVEKAMAKDPAERFQTAAQMADALLDREGPPAYLDATGERADADATVAVDRRDSTRVLHRDTVVPAQGEVRALRRRGVQPWVWAAMLLAVAGVFLAVMLLNPGGRDAAQNQPEPTPTVPTPAPTGTIHPRLDDAIEELEQAVRQ